MGIIKEVNMSGRNDENSRNIFNNLESDRRIENIEKIWRLDAKLRRMYEELRPYAPRLINEMQLSVDFNPNLFPKDLMDVVEHIACNAEMDTISVLLALVGSISSAMCGRYCIQLDPEWWETCCLFIVIAALSGSRKSLVSKMLGFPFDKQFAEWTEEHEAQSAEYEKTKTHLELLKRKLTSAIVGSHLKDSFSDGIYSGNPKEALSDLQSTVNDLDQHLNSTKSKFSTAPQIFLSIASRVSAGADMSKQGEYASVSEAEGSFFEGEIANKSTHPGLYLKAYDMERYDYSSIKVGKVAMRRPAMTITAFVQPDVLMAFYKNNNLKARGLNARFLPHFASKPISFSPLRALPIRSKAGAMIVYNSKITEMLKRNFTQDKNREIWTVSVTPEAYAEIKAFEQAIKQCVTNPEYSHMSSFLAKAHGAVVRIALCIHAWNNPKPEQCPITREEVDAALSLMSVIAEHANVAFAPERSQARVDAQAILDWVRRCDWTECPIFTDLDARNAISGLNKKRSHAALDLLEQHDYIRQYFEAGRNRICVLNPQLVEHNLPQRSRLIGRY
jgi:hypothetical protein